MENLFGSNYCVLQQDDELGLQYHPVPSFSCELHTIPEDFVINHSHANSLAQFDGDFLEINEKRKRPQRKITSDDKQKRVIRRDAERQRRQEMANLYASLRMQLPMDYVKQTGTLPDLIHAAANYVKHKEMKIEELKIKRDTLKNLSNDQSSSSCSYLRPIDVTVGTYLGGIEILISVDMRRDNPFPLSRVLEVVLAKGLSVVSCFCTKPDGRTLYTIQIEVSDLGGVDIYELQKELNDIVNTP